MPEPELDDIDAILADDNFSFDEPIAVAKKKSYQWTEDCFWVMEHLGEKITKAKAQTASRWALFQFAKKDTDKFVGQIMPRAMNLLDKALEKEGDDQTIVVKEEKNIAELKEILTRAVAESLAAK